MLPNNALVKLQELTRASLSDDILLPSHRPSVGAKEEVPVFGEVPQSELVVVHCEEFRRELLVVPVVLSAEVSSAPTGIDQLPLAVINPNSIPCVTGVKRWYGLQCIY